MARLSDIIENFIKEMLENNNESELQIQRNELANYFSCAPSQINYVLTTRFTSDRGYYVESRRGGGGYIIIRRNCINNNKILIDVLSEKIGNSITYDGGVMIIEGLLQTQIINNREAILMKVAINDRVLNPIIEYKNEVRASILKNMLISILV